MNAVVNFTNELSGRWAEWLVVASVDSAALLALVSLTWLAIRRRVPPQVGCCLFLLVILKLLLPLSLPMPGGVARCMPSALVMSRAASRQADPPREKIPNSSFAGTWQTKRSETAPRLAPLAPVAAHGNDSVAPPNEPNPLAGAMPIAAHHAAESPRLTLTTALMAGWLAVVIALTAVTLRNQWRFGARVRRLAPVDAACLGIDLRELCHLAGVIQMVRLVESDDLDAPAVWGLLRPTVILPRGAASALSASQLRWVLLHELAHVRRFDLAALMLQRCAAVLYFFNPLVWIANRMVDRLREYACDDFAVVLEGSALAEAADVFLQILRFAQRRSVLGGALGMFGLGTRAVCFRRVRRLLDSERPMQPRLSRWAICFLILVALGTLPYLRAADNGESKPQADSETSDRKQDVNRDKADDEPVFDLFIVGPDGRAVPHAQVEIRTRPNPNAEQVLTGEFVKHGSYGTFMEADDAGHLRVTRPRAANHFSVDITTPGFGPYWANWSAEVHPEEIPAQFTAHLEAGWSVGGVVVDENEKPIEGVRVRPSIEFKKRPGDARQFAVGTNLKTDAAGKWRFDSVPASMREVFVEIDHADYLPLRRPLTRDKFEIGSGDAPSARLVLSAGLTVRGKITDESGNPIAGALIRTKFFNDKREATSADDGSYQLTGCEPKTTRIVVWAVGRALDMKEVRVDHGMGPVDFQLRPGGHLRIRMLDERGQPVPKGWVFFQRWRGHVKYFEFDHVNRHADLDGIWEWNEAPLDELHADIGRPGGMQLAGQPLIARDDEYVFRLPPALVVSGNVIDAETKQPIAKFRVVPGIRHNVSQTSWMRREQFVATDGKYSVRQTYGYFAHLVRIEADGYLSEVSRDIKSDEGAVTIDFALKKGPNVTATVVTPNGQPAAGAKVALGVVSSQIYVRDGEIDDSPTRCARQDTGAGGAFQFPPQDEGFHLVITHPAGFAHVKTTEEKLPKQIALRPWARVEGTFRIGKEQIADVPITIMSNAIDTHRGDAPHISTRQEATTGKDGQFVFERVVPGPASIGRNLRLTPAEGALEAISACLQHADFPGGKTSHIDLGGKGRQVVGRLRPPPDYGRPVLWHFAVVQAVPNPDKPAQSAVYNCTATVGRDGRFHLDDLPGGDWLLSVRFAGEPAGLYGYRFQVPLASKDASGPIDLGELTLKAD